jgi:hypothetical protein
LAVLFPYCVSTVPKTATPVSRKSTGVYFSAAPYTEQRAGFGPAPSSAQGIEAEQKTCGFLLERKARFLRARARKNAPIKKANVFSGRCK